MEAGLKTPFSPTSETDFQHINGNLPEPLYISRTQQLMEVIWDEKGAEATAITGFGGDPFGAPPTPDPNSFHPFIVNHPFVFIIYTTDKKEMLFAGFISDPSQMTTPDANRP
jgi:serine protease inhibitor